AGGKLPGRSLCGCGGKPLERPLGRRLRGVLHPGGGAAAHAQVTAVRGGLCGFWWARPRLVNGHHGAGKFHRRRSRPRTGGGRCVYLPGPRRGPALCLLRLLSGEIVIALLATWPPLTIF